MKNHLLSEVELIEYAKGESLIDRLRGLFDHQIDNWDLAKQNYADLKSVIVHEKLINNISIKLQFNPKRVKSTTADLSLKQDQDECILCETNLPVEQKFIKYYKEYNFLVNPYPIFKEHFTIAKCKHVPQSISSYLNDLLLLSRDVGERYAIFYNGPQCGASIPQHLHFQMGNKESFPIFEQLKNISKDNSCLSIERKKLSFHSIELTKRFIFLIESNDSIEIMNSFSILISFIRSVVPGNSEPMLNIVSLFEDKKWRLIIFLRKKHRPSFYYLENNKKIVVSPAAVDMSGLMILPREEDLDKFNKETIEHIYREVSITKELNEYLITKLKAFYL